MPSLYETVLESAWAGVPEHVRRVHEPGESRGVFTVERGAGLLTALTAFACGLPSPGDAVPIHLRVTAHDGTQTWERSFGTRRLTSRLRRAGSGEMVERYGLFECRFAVTPGDGALTFRSTGAAVRFGPLRLPLPACVAPVIDGQAVAAGDAVRVDVGIRAGWRALLLRYHGLVRAQGPA